MSQTNNKNTWIVAGIIVFLFIIGGVIVFSSQAVNTNTGAQNAKSNFSVAEKSYNFGSVSMAAGKVTKVFTLKNISAAPITIKKMYTSCMCTSASLLEGDSRIGPFGMLGHGFIPTINREVGAGKDVQVEVVFDPAAHGPSGVGSIVRNIFIETADGAKLSLEINAFVTP